MSTSITVGKARLSTIAVISGGQLDVTTQLGIGTGNHDTLRIFLNPDNNRQVAVVGIAPSPSVNAIVQFGSHTISETFEVVPAPPPEVPPDGLSFGTWGDEIEPPSWAQ